MASPPGCAWQLVWAAGHRDAAPQRSGRLLCWPGRLYELPFLFYGLPKPTPLTAPWSALELVSCYASCTLIRFAQASRIARTEERQLVSEVSGQSYIARSSTAVYIAGAPARHMGLGAAGSAFHCYGIDS